jgi:fused signal recognition particle receptor
MRFSSLFGFRDKDKEKEKEKDEVGPAPEKSPSFFEKIKSAVMPTYRNFTERIQDLVEGKREIDPEMLDELEAIMLGADIGVATTTEVLDIIRDKA